MWSDGVVLLQPVVNDDSGLCERRKQPPIQTSRAKDRIETLVVGVLPGAAGLDIVGIHVVLLKPFLNHCGDQFRTIVAAKTGWPTVNPEQPGEYANDIASGQASADLDR